jgi:hypothetical protein
MLIDDYTSWPIFQFGLQHGLIDWRTPSFHRSNEMSKEI